MLTYFEREFNRKAGEKIKKARQKLKLTQVELAKFLGISNQRLCRYESGIILVPAWVLMVVSEEAAKQDILPPPPVRHFVRHILIHTLLSIYSFKIKELKVFFIILDSKPALLNSCLRSDIDNTFSPSKNLYFFVSSEFIAFSTNSDLIFSNSSLLID